MIHEYARLQVTWPSGQGARSRAISSGVQNYWHGIYVISTDDRVGTIPICVMTIQMVGAKSTRVVTSGQLEIL
jgi:hypothetical protein